MKDKIYLGKLCGEPLWLEVDAPCLPEIDYRVRRAKMILDQAFTSGFGPNAGGFFEKA